MNQQFLDFDEPERSRRDTQKHKILARLQQGAVTNLELNNICFRYSARIHELRKAGHKIKCEQIGAGVTKYSLDPKP